jgi:hypothetical protein
MFFQKIATKSLFPIAIAGLMISACSPEAPAASEQAPAQTTPVSHGPDTREKLHLNAKQRHHVLTEMRQLLSSTQGVIDGIAHDDMVAIAEAAALSGPMGKATVDMRMRDAFPEGFRPMGKAIHVEFGQIAEMAGSGASKEEISTKLADAMNLCVACHSTYQIELVE